MATHITRDKWFDVEGRFPVAIECPKCEGGNLGSRAPHGIRANGEVFQSVVCGHPPCDFHDFVILDGWVGGEIPHA